MWADHSQVWQASRHWCRYSCHLSAIRPYQLPGPRLNIKQPFLWHKNTYTGKATSLYWDPRLSFDIRIPILVRRHLCIETATPSPHSPFLWHKNTYTGKAISLYWDPPPPPPPPPASRSVDETFYRLVNRAPSIEETSLDTHQWADSFTKSIIYVHDRNFITFMPTDVTFNSRISICRCLITWHMEERCTINSSVFAPNLLILSSRNTGFIFWKITIIR